MDNVSKNYNLTEGTVWKVMLRFAMPVFLGTLFQSLYTTADAVIIGKFAGKSALAAIESVYTITRIPGNLFIGIASGASILISQFYGASKNKDVVKISHNAMLFAFIIGIVLTVSGCLLSPFIIGMIRVPDEIAKEANWYLFIYLSGLSASMIYNVGSGILRALGNSKIPFYFLIVSNVLNISMDLILVVFFRQGVIGAAFATVTAQFLSAVLIILFFIKTDLPCKLCLDKLRFDKLSLIKIFKLGLPIGIQYSLYPISNTIVQANINKIGVDSIAAWAVCGKLDFLIWAISDAFSASLSAFVAQNYGAKKYDNIRKGVGAALIMALFSAFLVSGFLFFFSGKLAGILLDDKTVVSITAHIMHFISPFYIVYVFGDVLPGALRGVGDTFRPMLVTVLGICLSRILWILAFLPFKPKLITVLGCYPLSWGITAIMIVYLYLKNLSKSRLSEAEA